MLKSIELSLVAAAALTAAVTTAKADYCERVVIDAVNQKIGAEFNNQTAEIRDTLATLEAAGKTNTAIYRELAAAITKASQDFSAAGSQAASQGVNDCRRGLAPVQNIVDNMMAGLTGGLSRVLPPNMTHIDMGEVLSGNILGGDGSFFRKQLGIKW